MNRTSFFRVTSACLLIGALSVPALAGNNARAVMRMMPADMPLAIVVPNFEELDRNLLAVGRRFKPGSNDPGILDDLKRSLDIGKWIDFSKPIGIGIPSIGGERSMILWAVIPNAMDKIKSYEEAKEVNGIWEIPLGGDDTFFVALKGEYVIVSDAREFAARTVKDDESLALHFRSRENIFEKRDALIHINFSAVRPMIQKSIGQFSQMIPMIAMMAGQQGGGDATAMIGMFTAIVDAVNGLVNQLDYLDLTVGLSKESADITLATGFADGPIKDYLTRQKPAAMPLLSEIEEQPYFLAAAYHLPGDSSPFIDFIFDKMSKAAEGGPMAMFGMAPALGTPNAKGDKNDDQAAAKESMAVMRQLYTSLIATNVVIATSPEGMRMAGDYVGKNPRALAELVKASITGAKAPPMIQQFGGVSGYESLGSRRIGGTLVEEFALKIDSTNPAGAMVANMYGEGTRFALGVTGNRVRFGMGSEEHIQNVFRSNVTKPFASGRFAKAALSALPAKRNGVLLIDLPAVLPLVAPLAGLPKMDAIPPGPPIAASFSLSGEPARVDIHIPLRAIERVMQAFAPDEPM